MIAVIAGTYKAIASTNSVVTIPDPMLFKSAQLYIWSIPSISLFLLMNKFEFMSFNLILISINADLASYALLPTVVPSLNFFRASTNDLTSGVNFLFVDPINLLLAGAIKAVSVP